MALLAPAAMTFGQGRLAIEGPDTVDFGTYPGWERRAASYTLRNTGENTLRILDVRNTCGCATVGFKTAELTAGRSVALKVVVIPNSIFGEYRKATYIRSSDPTTPLTKLWVKGNATPLVGIKPQPFVSAGILGTDQSMTWTYSLKPNRWPITFTPLQTTSSVPVEVSLVVPKDKDSSGKLTVRMPATATPTNLSIAVHTRATFETNTVPLSFGINGLAGPHLVAAPSRLEVAPTPAQPRRAVRLHLVAPRHTPTESVLDTLELPEVEGVLFAPPRRERNGKGVTVGITFQDTFASRVQSEGTVPITFRVPGAAPATLTCTAPNHPTR